MAWCCQTPNPHLNQRWPSFCDHIVLLRLSELTHWGPKKILQWRHNEQNGVSNHRRLDCLLNRSVRRRSKKTSKLRVTSLYEENSPVTGEFPAQKVSNAENVSIWWRYHVAACSSVVLCLPSNECKDAALTVLRFLIQNDINFGTGSIRDKCKAVYKYKMKNQLIECVQMDEWVWWYSG